MLKELMGRRARIALTAALVSLAVPAAAQAALVQSPPVDVQGGHFDDHSIGTDNHLGWSYGSSDDEPLAITFGSTVTNTGPAAFRVCGYSSGTSAGWMRAFEVSGASCPPTAPAGQDGWFRYITANHDNPSRALFNRWHLMDLQRFALVPLPVAAGGPAGAMTAWDTYWGTCLNENEFMACEQNENATTVATNVAVGATKTTQERNPAPDAQRIAIPAESRTGFPDGLYQVVAVANPYGRFSGPASVSCVTVSVSGLVGYSQPVVTQVGGLPATCYVPAQMTAALTGPGGRDPMAGSVESGCTLQTSGHCWATVPMADDPVTGPHPPALTNVTAANAVTATNTVPVAQAGGVQNAPAPLPGTSNPPAAAAGQSHTRRSTTRRMTARASRTYTRRALRKQFGRRLSRVRVTCRVRTSTASTCRVSFRKSGARYSGNVWLRYRTVNSRLRWQYRVEVKKRKSGERTRTIKRSYRTGGTF